MLRHDGIRRHILARRAAATSLSAAIKIWKVLEKRVRDGIGDAGLRFSPLITLRNFLIVEFPQTFYFAVSREINVLCIKIFGFMLLASKFEPIF